MFQNLEKLIGLHSEKLGLYYKLEKNSVGHLEKNSGSGFLLRWQAGIPHKIKFHGAD